MRLIDISRPVGTGTPVWPGDAPCRLRWTSRRAEGAPANVAAWCATTHCGTHVDAPHHALEDGARVAELPLDPFAGPAQVVDARGWEEIGLGAVEEALAAGGQERLLFRTGCWTDPARFPRRFPALSPEAAARLRDAGVRLVGTDAPSVDPFDSESLPAHRVLAEAGIPVLENLWLDEALPGRCELIAFPLRLEEADASPVRAVLRVP